jgi:hypothetical protein
MGKELPRRRRKQIDPSEVKPLGWKVLSTKMLGEGAFELAFCCGGSFRNTLQYIGDLCSNFAFFSSPAQCSPVAVANTVLTESAGVCSELSEDEAALVQGAFLQRFIDSVPRPYFTGEIEKAVCNQHANLLRVYVLR